MVRAQGQYQIRLNQPNKKIGGRKNYGQYGSVKFVKDRKKTEEKGVTPLNKNDSKPHKLDGM